MKPIHLITMSGNSRRFIDAGYDHKALCEINGQTTIKKFVDSWGDFHEYETIFLCRNEDLDKGRLSAEINRVAPYAKIFGVETNSGGPVYSISKIFKELNKFDHSNPILVSYIDTLQKTSLARMFHSFKNHNAGLTVHGLKNPHWRTSRSYCLVKAEPTTGLVTYIQEKYPFTEKDFEEGSEKEQSFGSSGNYYFESLALMQNSFEDLMLSGVKVNNEFYVTQAVENLVNQGLGVKAYKCPYAALGVPEDLEDYAFWERWHDKNIS